MQRILVLGSCGAGKSTFARQLAEKIGLPIIHLDQHYWQPNWVATPDAEWEEKVKELSEGETWIIDGNYSRTMDIRLKRADTVVLLDFPTWLCIFRVLKRRIMFHNKARPDMNPACPEKIDLEFIHLILTYKIRSRGKTLQRLQWVREQTRIEIVRTQKQANQLLKKLTHDFHTLESKNS